MVEQGGGKPHVKLIDQSRLPLEIVHVEARTVDEVAIAIKSMKIRGAPAIGIAAAFAMALAAAGSTARTREGMLKDLGSAKAQLDATRPTAVNLSWATSRMIDFARNWSDDVDLLAAAIIGEAKRLARDDVETNMRMSQHGASLLSDGDTVLTHCNAGALGCVDVGTALGAIRAAVSGNKDIKVISCETRPRFQGAKLTCWELQQDGIDVTQVIDSSTGLLMQRGMVDVVMVGADRIVSDAVFNKIGTFSLAIIAKYHGVPFHVVAPVSTLDLRTTMADVEIERRDPVEVTMALGELQLSPPGTKALNFAFDATPLELVTSIVTEDGVFAPGELVQRYMVGE